MINDLKMVNERAMTIYCPTCKEEYKTELNLTKKKGDRLCFFFCLEDHHSHPGGRVTISNGFDIKY